MRRATGWATVVGVAATLIAGLAGSAAGVRLSDYPAGGVRATIVTAKAFSPAALALAVAGFLTGALLGGLAAVAAVRRHRRHGPVLRGVTGTVAAAVVTITLGYAAQIAMLAYHLSAEGRWQARDVQLAEFVLTVLPPVSIAVATAVLAALALLALPPGRATATIP